MKSLRESTGLDLASAKAVIHHLADPNCTCHRCHAPLGGGLLTACFYCRSLNYDPCGKTIPHDAAGADQEVRRLFGEYGSTDRHDEWCAATAGLQVGATASGRVALVYHFGVFVDVGIGFPALLEVVEFDHRGRRHDERAPWPVVGEMIEVRVAYINDEAHVIRLTQKQEDKEWQLWRQDDGGHQFVVATFGTREEAEREMLAYEDRGHKQVYWVSRRKEELT